MVDVPGVLVPVTVAPLIVATAVLLLTQAPPPVVFPSVLAPRTHALKIPVIGVGTMPFIVTSDVLVRVQPLFDAVAVYVVVTAGKAYTVLLAVPV